MARATTLPLSARSPCISASHRLQGTPRKPAFRPKPRHLHRTLSQKALQSVRSFNASGKQSRSTDSGACYKTGLPTATPGNLRETHETGPNPDLASQSLRTETPRGSQVDRQLPCGVVSHHKRCRAETCDYNKKSDDNNDFLKRYYYS